MASPENLGGFEGPEKLWMLGLARSSIENFARGLPLPPVDAPPPRLTRKQACFVTLSKRGVLRGCIGSVQALQPLYRGVQENARAAASRDPRFPPVAAAELDELKIQISVLTEPRRLTFDRIDALLSQLRPGVSGVLLEIGARFGTFLPQVWRQIPERVEFLNRLAEKGGFPPDAWRGPGVAISVYTVECFEESDGLDQH